MTNLKIIFVSILWIFIRHNSNAQVPSHECVQWFRVGKIDSASKDCDSKCATLMVDMGTFDCPSQCDLLCKTQRGPSSSLGKFIFYPGLTQAEKKLVLENGKEAIIVFVQKTRAEWSSDRNFPDQSLNDESDAFRHFVWAGLLIKELKEDRARKFLDAHEENHLQSSSEREMDIYNNERGIQAAKNLILKKNWDLKSLENEALSELKLKNLRVLKPGLHLPEKAQ